jgi:hypothetical protein
MMPTFVRTQHDLTTDERPAFGRGMVRVCALLAFVCLAVPARAGEPAQPSGKAGSDVTQLLPLLGQYCLGCHSTAKHKGDLDLERFGTLAQIRRDVKPWQAMVEMVEAGEMPPKNKPQPTPEERKRLLEWVNAFLDSEAHARAGDPGLVPMRRLSNAEYDYSIRDLTGVDLQPAREFPADGAAGEGFTNAAEALADMSPTLLNKYLLSAKGIAGHAVLLPDGFRFSSTNTRRDWSNEIMADLRKFYGQFTPDGKLQFEPYLLATLRHRDALLAGHATIDEIAAKENLNPKYFRTLWGTLTNEHLSFPLNQIQAHWRQASEKESGAIAAEIAAWQAQAWKVVAIGSYRNGDTRQVANDLTIAESRTIRLPLKPAPGERDVVVYLSARDVFPAGKDGNVVWSRPRLEADKKPELLLRDYPKFGPAFEVDYAAVFADSAKYLGAVVEAANDKKLGVEDVAKKDGLDPARLKKWVDLLALAPLDKSGAEPESAMREVPASKLEPLSEKVAQNGQKPAINGWRNKGADLPVLISNSSDTEEHIPGRASPHKVVVHPTPTEFVAAVWKSPIEGKVRVSANIAHAHPNCGNGVAWWLELRRGDHAGVLAEGAIGVGGAAQVPAKSIKISKGDLLVLAIDAKNGDHSCDLTEIALTVTEADQPGRVWDLAGDVADTVLEGNPHADRLGNKDVWSFVKGPTRPVVENSSAPGAMIAADSVLGRWRDAASDPAHQADAEKLAGQVQALLTGAQPAKENHPDRALYDKLVSGDSALLKGLDLSTFARGAARETHYGLEAGRFGGHAGEQNIDDASVVAAANSVVEIRLPAELARGHEFVVEGKLASGATDHVVHFDALAAPPAASAPWDGKSPVVAAAGGAARKQLVQGLDDFRACFPLFTCFPGIIPVDEVVCLRMYHRDDEPLVRLFLNDEQRRQLDRLWEEHRFITQWPIAENKYLPLFIGFVTQDQTKELVAYFENMREPFRKRAEDFGKELEAAAPRQLERLLDFASRAYRRPLQERERADLLTLYKTLRDKGIPHEEAFRGVLARVLVSPSFLLRMEQAPPGKEAAPVNDWELATRLSYFLWSTVPDEALREAAASGRLHDPAILAAQAQRMLKDDRVRALGIEFGTQWIHVRGFDEFKEKSETLYPMFDAPLRSAIYEESILFFQDLFQRDEPIDHLLDANYTYLNETLAKHYGIPGVSGPQWRKVEDVRKYGRGGILALASVQAKQAGAARTSPVLRGNWVVETLLGEKLPRPPPDVPKLPESEGTDGLTMRQLVEKHTQVEACAVCHRRMDPLGFSFERYDSIGRLRDKESSGLPIDCRAKLKDGTEFEGLDGLRNYLLTKKRDVVVRLFCRRLLGYALGRAVILSDQPLIDEMVAALNHNGGQVSAAVLEIVRSPQFRSIRGSAYAEDE